MLYRLRRHQPVRRPALAAWAAAQRKNVRKRAHISRCQCGAPRSAQRNGPRFRANDDDGAARRPMQIGPARRKDPLPRLFTPRPPGTCLRKQRQQPDQHCFVRSGAGRRSRAYCSPALHRSPLGRGARSAQRSTLPLWRACAALRWNFAASGAASFHDAGLCGDGLEVHRARRGELPWRSAVRRRVWDFAAIPPAPGTVLERALKTSARVWDFAATPPGGRDLLHARTPTEQRPRLRQAAVAPAKRDAGANRVSPGTRRCPLPERVSRAGPNLTKR